MSVKETPTSFFTCLIAGGAAGTVTDLSLYPLDTIKTRLQSSQGFMKAGGFSGVYKGLGAAALGSAPGSALFFATYEKMKDVLSSNQKNMNIPMAGHSLTHSVTHSLTDSLSHSIILIHSLIHSLAQGCI